MKFPTLPVLRTVVPILGAFLLTLGMSVGVRAGELETTYRVGDVIQYSSGCTDLGAAEAIAMHAATDPRIVPGMVGLGKCFEIHNPANKASHQIPLQLKAWMSGPYEGGQGDFSIWLGIDVVFSTPVYAFVPDGTGDHEPAKEN